MGLPDWLLHTSVTITAGAGAGANYQHNLYLHYGNGQNAGQHVYFNGKCKTDFTDVRVANETGMFLPITLKQVVASTTATLVFKDLADNDIDHTVTVYYSNPSATDVSDDATVFIDSISGVVGAWPMDEALATDPVVDYSGNGNDGTPTGTTVVDGKYVGTKARLLDGITDNIVVPYEVLMDFTNTSQFVLEALIKTTDDTLSVVMGKLLGTKYYMLEIQQTNSLPLIVVKDGTTQRHRYGTTALDDGLWHHIIAVINTPSDMKIYVDGNVENGGNSLGVLNDFAFEDVFEIGSGVAYFGGSIMHCRVYNDLSDLSESSIENLADNFGDPSLEAGKVLVRKWATTTLPAFGDWSPPAAQKTSNILYQRRMRQRELEKRRKQRQLLVAVQEWLQFKVNRGLTNA